MGKNRKYIAGISLISLIISIVVTIILLSTIVPDGVGKINKTQTVTFNHNLSLIGSEVQSYMIMNKSELPVKTDINGNYILYSIKSSSTLLVQATNKNDQNDNFYIIDIDKIKLDNNDLGVGRTVDDYYIIASTSKNIYYARGVEVDGKLYHTRVDTID